MADPRLPAEERTEKRRRIVGLLDAEGLDVVVLRSPASVAWWSGGGRGTVLLDSPVAVAAIVVRRDGESIVTDAIEGRRLAEEELAPLVDDGAELVMLAWTDDPVAALPTGERVGDDVARAGVRDVGQQLQALRASLVPAEVERYRSLSRDAAAAMTAAWSRVGPDATEYDAAGVLADELSQRAIDPLLLLAAGEERIRIRRHPLPTTARLGSLGLLVTCARRDGLIANLTRCVSWGPVDEADLDAERRLLEVERGFLEALRPGARIADVFAAGTAGYAAAGFAANEWTRHHQGGPCGYAPRDAIASPDADGVVAAEQAFAWNPSAPGVKVEDTVLVHADGTVEVLTVDPAWPVTEIGGRQRPLVDRR